MSNPTLKLPGLDAKPAALSLKAANAALGIPAYYFDRRDHALVRIINQVVGDTHRLAYLRRQYYGYFHPHGIKEMTESRSLCIAYAMGRLLTSLAIGGVDDRLEALRALRAEVLDTAEGPLPKNTARALMQIMKEVIRSRDNPVRQLRLAHDFRITAAGKPRVVRKQLRRYGLLEMPERWNQVAFDDHLHDAHTKGRKSSTHLIMDAWIRGIRRLRIVHYSHIEPRFATELLEAARIMQIDVRIGIEFHTRFRGKTVNLIWVPRSFTDAQAFLCFLEEPAMAALMEKGRQASDYQQALVMQRLAVFNQKDLPQLNHRLQMQMPPLDPRAFATFVGMGQKSILHLQIFLQQEMLAALQRKAEQLRTVYATAEAEDRKAIAAWFERTNRLDLGQVADDVFKGGAGQAVHDIVPHPVTDDPPDLLTQTPGELLARLAAQPAGYHITINLSNLEAADVLELLYDSNGAITRLELFNLKDWAAGHTAHIPEINRLQEAINSNNPLRLKRVIQDIIRTVETTPVTEKAARIAKLKIILHDIVSLQAMYRHRPLKARMGSDYTGRSPRFYGMGLAVVETLPPRVQRQLRRELQAGRKRLPIEITVHKRFTFIPARNGDTVRRRRWWRRRLATRHLDWDVQSEATRIVDHGNVIALGVTDPTVDNGLRIEPNTPEALAGRLSPSYLNSHIRNLFKVVSGFIPAFATFYITKDWWLLAYLGAFIWFGITGVRNVVQSVLGGGGLRRSPLLRWNVYVSWDRIADSLLFTGFSVPLLDYLTKTVVLERMCGITIATHPIVLYTLMAVVNGLYLSTHNALRGLPKAAVYGNFFRSALSIPVALLINLAVGQLLTAAGALNITDVLQKWAAIISKTASDFMAGIIEGTADRHQNIRLRYRDYRNKMADLMDIYARLELLYPETETYPLLDPSDTRRRSTNQ
ncbi:MAG: hypothetical protein HKP58_03270, partial [Desulfatitalea sp.]|nr:hypothetical protein [Desulfatitalea sp.]NNJ99413.1 hypothetical protein [Desulfatitalea sp.]